MEGSQEESDCKAYRRLICELLVKNQQLRMALMEMTPREPGTPGLNLDL
jgi:hypothetical protein